MASDPWKPTCVRPTGLVLPVAIDAMGWNGPTRGAARGPRWRRVGPGRYLPAEVDGDVVEQRILTQSVRLPPGGGVTAWAALRWRGAAYFDGIGHGGQRLAVPLLVAGKGSRGPDPDVRWSWEQFPPWEREVVSGLACASVARALYDETRWSVSDRRAVVAVDMTVAAGLISVDEFRDYVESRPA